MQGCYLLFKGSGLVATVCSGDFAAAGLAGRGVGGDFAAAGLANRGGGGAGRVGTTAGAVTSGSFAGFGADLALPAAGFALFGLAGALGTVTGRGTAGRCTGGRLTGAGFCRTFVLQGSRGRISGNGDRCGSLPGLFRRYGNGMVNIAKFISNALGAIGLIFGSISKAFAGAGAGG